MEKSFEKTNGTNTTIIGSSDGPTSVFLVGGHKPNIKQKIQKKAFELRKKWYALWIKPGTHTMEDVACYVKEKYHFVECSKDSKIYRHQYDELRASFIMQYQPELLGEYAKLPELASEEENEIREFLAQMRIRQEKAKEVPEELFSLDYYYLEKQEKDDNMHIQLESHYEYIGGGFSGGKNNNFKRIYKDIYKYYGVSEDDIANNTKRYQNLLRTLAIRH